jgi:tetratricopeptide (TPR) repeat protein
MLERIESAEIAYLSGRTQEALSALLAVLAEGGEDHRAFMSLGVIYHCLGQFEEAKASFKRALSIRPGDPEAVKNLALALMSQTDFFGAKRLLEESLEKDADDYLLWNLLSKVEARLDNYAASIACARRSLSLNPEQGAHLQAPLDSDRLMFERIFQRHARNEKKRMAFFLSDAQSPEMDILSEGLSKYFRAEKVMSFKYDVYRSAAQRADVVWIEGLSKRGAKFLNDRESLKGKAIIVRLSREDVLSPAARGVSFLDAGLVVLESYFLKDLFLKDNPMIKDESAIQVFQRAVDHRHFDYAPRFGNRRIAAVVPKNFEMAEFVLLLEAFLSINRKFPDTELHLDCGQRNVDGDFHVNQFLTENGIGYKVHFHSYGNELKAFLNENHYILSSETFSGSRGNIEALMLGLKPLIHSSPGAMELYPESCLWKNLSEVASLYENPPDTRKISLRLKEVHKPQAIVSQYVQKFITLKWC